MPPPPLPVPPPLRNTILDSVGNHSVGWTHVRLVPDEVAEVSVLHVGQDHQRGALARQADAQQRQYVGVAEVLHDDAFPQELGHLLNVCDAFTPEQEKKGLRW